MCQGNLAQSSKLKDTAINLDVKPFIFFLSVSFALKSRIARVPYEIHTLKEIEVSATEVKLNKF